MSARIDGRRSSAATSRTGPERAPEPEHDERGDAERSRVEEERRRRGRGEQERAERRTDELVGDDLGRVEAPVGESRARSRSTMFGRIDCAALSNSVSAEPRANATTAMQRQRRGVGEHEHARAGPISEHPEPVDDRHRPPAVAAGRPARRRASAKNSQGSVPANETSETSVGERVSDAARSGSAASVTPSPRFETVAAVQSRR